MNQNAKKMSERDAKTPEVAKVVGIFTAMGGTRMQDTGKEIKVKKGSKVKKSQSGEVNSSSKLDEKVTEMDTQGGKDEPTSSIQSLFDPEVKLNEDEIAEIAKYLDYKDIKSLRQVDTLWSAGVTPTFVRNSVLVLKAGQRREEELESFETTNLNGLKAMRIELFSKFEFEKESELFNHILANLSPSLRSLQLEIWSNKSVFLPPADIRLPALSSLSFNSRYVHEETRRRLFELLFPSAPNLVELVVPNFESAFLSLLLTQDGSRNWALVPKLKSLKIRSYLCSEELSTLANFPPKWESLVLKVRPGEFRRNDTFELLSQLLEANKDSLVRLNLEMSTHGSGENRQTLRFPNTFPKLVELKLKFWDKDNLLSFGGVAVNYSKMFPCLTSLSVKSYYDNLENLTGIWAFLFPQFRPQVFWGLECLELGRNCVVPLRNVIVEDWAERMFPNARIVIN